jgi:uncharacterized protein
MYQQAKMLATLIESSMPDVKISIEPGYLTVDCLVAISTGKAQLGLLKNWQLDFGARGIYPYKMQYPNVNGLLNYGTMGGILHFVVRSETGIRSFLDIAEKRYPLRLSIPNISYSSHHLAIFVLEAYGMTFSDIESWGGAVTIEEHDLGMAGLKAGSRDAVAGSSYLPADWVKDWRPPPQIDLLPFEKDRIKENILSKYCLLESTIPMSTYDFLDKDVNAFRDIDILAASSDLQKKLAYDITKSICESYECLTNSEMTAFFNPRDSWRNIPHLHAGSQMYFEEMRYATE